MNSVLTKFVSNTYDQIGEYGFTGTLLINSGFKDNSIQGIISKNGVDAGHISIDLDFDSNRITKKEHDIVYNWIPKEIINQFIDRFIAEVNRQYTAYIAALNS